MELDANNDRVIERAEVPEAGRKAFERLLNHGDANHDGKLEAEEFRDLLQKVDWSRAVSPSNSRSGSRILTRTKTASSIARNFKAGPPGSASSIAMATGSSVATRSPG